MSNTELMQQDELQHHGIPGMKWGIRRYQNKDGSLTAAGKKRYDNEFTKVKAAKAKLAKDKKVLDNKKKTQAKLDKLEKAKQDVVAKRKALKEEEQALKNKNKKPKNEKPVETVEERRAKLLKSSDAKELYENRHLLTTAELNERINRINTEKQLGQIAASTKTSGREKIEKMIAAYKKTDEVIKTVSDSFIGKELKKKLGIDKIEKEFDWEKAYKNVDKMSDEELKKAAQRAENRKKVSDAWDNVKKSRTKDSTTDDNSTSNPGKKDTENDSGNKKTETFTGTVEGEGTSKGSQSKSTTKAKPSNYYDPIDSYGEWVNDSASNLPAVVTNTGRSWVAGYLEDWGR